MTTEVNILNDGLMCSLTPFGPENDYCCTYHFPYSEDLDDYSESEPDSDADSDKYLDARSHSGLEPPGDGADSDAGEDAGHDIEH
jgi:hypothetical protein